MAYTSMELTIRELKKRKWDYGIVERFIHNPAIKRFGNGYRSDLFGIFDLVVLSEDSIIGLQTCKNSFAEHYRKITDEKKENALKWLQRGGKIELWNWSKKLSKKGGKLKTWQAKIVQITVDEIG